VSNAEITVVATDTLGFFLPIVVQTKCKILLLMADSDDPLFLQVKEARTSVLEPYAGKSVYPNRGQRVVAKWTTPPS